MAEMKYFLHQIKHTNDAYDKGIVVKDTFEAAKQSYHAYLGAYAYGQQANTDFVSVMISNTNGTTLMAENWVKQPERDAVPEVEQESTPEIVGP